jgi:hypothetical protein
VREERAMDRGARDTDDVREALERYKRRRIDEIERQGEPQRASLLTPDDVRALVDGDAPVRHQG